MRGVKWKFSPKQNQDFQVPVAGSHHTPALITPTIQLIGLHFERAKDHGENWKSKQNKPTIFSAVIY